MMLVSRRWNFGTALLTLGVVTSLAAFLLVGGCESPTQNPVDGGGGTVDQTGQGTDLSTVGAVSVTGVVPASGLAAGGNMVTIVGTGFEVGATVSFGTSPATNVQIGSMTQLTAVVPASGGTLGPVAVTVRNPDGTTASNGSLYSYNRILVSFMTRIDAPVGPAGKNPVALVPLDSQGNGTINEIVTANQATSNVSVLTFNLGWKNPVVYPSCTSPTGLVAADFNGDAKTDLAVSCSNAANADVAILSSNGGVSFLNPVSFKVAMNVTALDARDVSGDGKIDLVVSARSTNMAYVLVNASMPLTPVFNVGNTYGLGTQPAGLLLANLNGDANPDIIATNFGDGTISVLLGSGLGAFGPAAATPTAAQPIAVAVGDLNKDGKLDVVVTSFSSKMITVLLGKGDGTFPIAKNLPAGNKPMSVAIADIDNDGNRDILFVNSGDDGLTVLLGRGDGSFEPQQTFATGSQPEALIVADLNGDGKPDVATANYNSSDVSIFYNQTY